jgi:hypothetical protein
MIKHKNKLTKYDPMDFFDAVWENKNVNCPTIIRSHGNEKLAYYSNMLCIENIPDFCIYKLEHLLKEA